MTGTESPRRARAERWGWKWDPFLTRHSGPQGTGAWTAPWQGGFLVYGTDMFNAPTMTPEKASRGKNRRIWSAKEVAAAHRAGPDSFSDAPTVVYH